MNARRRTSEIIRRQGQYIDRQQEESEYPTEPFNPPVEAVTTTFKRVMSRLGIGAICLIGSGALVIVLMVLKHEVTLATISVRLDQIVEMLRNRP